MRVEPSMVEDVRDYMVILAFYFLAVLLPVIGWLVIGVVVCVKAGWRLGTALRERK